MASKTRDEQTVQRNRIDYSVMSTTERLDTTLPRTLDSLASAGYINPPIYLDGMVCNKQCSGPIFESECGRNHRPRITPRFPRVGALGNWLLILLEMYIRNTSAQWYLIFQDDIQVAPGLREYLDHCNLPTDKAYCNLYTVPTNEQLAPKGENGRPEVGWYPSRQNGKGALGLLIPNSLFPLLILSSHAKARLRMPLRVRTRGIDGVVIRTAKKIGYCEYVHYPSLVQHIGTETTLNNRWKNPSTCFYPDLNAGEAVC